MDTNNFKEIFLLTTALAATISVAYIWFITSRRHLEVSSLLTKVAPILVATIAGVTSLMVAIVIDPDKSGFEFSTTHEITTTDKLSETINHLNNKTIEIEKTINALSAVSVAASSIDELSKYESRITKTEESIKRFEGILVTDAEKLITLPLLKKDMEGIRAEIRSVKELSENQAKFFQESLNQSRWILGTLGLGVLALIFPIARAALTGNQNES